MESRAAAFALSLLLLLLLLCLGFSTVANKPVVKTIQSEDGDVFDCIEINLQPAFDHPMLKNHSIQLGPSSYPSSINNQISSIPSSSHVKMESIQCPLGTVPIWRTQKADFTRFKSFTNLGGPDFINSHHANSPDDVPGRSNFAILQTRVGKYYGARASISVHGIPQVKTNQYSGAEIWLLGGKKDAKNFIAAGWLVAPSMSRDNNTRFFVGWQTNTNASNLCINHSCPGFVQVSSDIALGGKISPLSTYNGKQYHITVFIFKDPKTTNWWVTYGEDNKPVGYWPKSMFKYMINEAVSIEWGGISIAPFGQETPPIGSGHFASEGFGKAAFVRHIEIVDKHNNFIIPKWGDYIANFDRRCYQVDGISNKGGDIGLNFYFGGPACKY